MTRPYTDYFAMRDFRLRYRKFDGTMSAEVSRAAFVSGDASLVLPYDPRTDQILVLEQFRMAPFARGDKNPWLYEPVAGMIDLGETPQDCAIREAKEEADLDISHLIPISKSYPSPGGSTTFFHSFLGLCNLDNYNTKIGGVADENEDIRPHILPADQAIDMAIQGGFRALPLAMMVLWLQQYRQSDLVSR
jgi:nudix-type nucleoside diphosphatase (YffH/AdpP family)